MAQAGATFNDHRMEPVKLGSIWTRAFTLLCLAQFLGYAQHAMLAPSLPLYVSHLGGSPFIVGVVLACFAVTSVLIRPLIGHWADRWHEAGVLISGLFFQGASIFLCWLPWVEAAMLANGLRGVGWAGVNTGGYTLLARTAPESRRGEASGYYSGVQSASMLFFPAAALWLLSATSGNFVLVFAVSAVLSFLGAGVGLVMAWLAPRPSRPPQAKDSSVWWRELFRFVEPEILLPSALLFWLNLALPALMNFIVLYAREIGVENFPLYFIASGATSLLARPLLGRLSDRIGRSISVAAGFTLQVTGLLLVVGVSSLGGIIFAGVFYMLGNAIGSSTTLALAVERADPQRRGKAMATFSVAYPLSYGIGSLLTGSAVAMTGYVGMFVLLAMIEGGGLLFTLMNSSRLASRRA
jgi:MFS family permease